MTRRRRKKGALLNNKHGPDEIPIDVKVTSIGRDGLYHINIFVRGVRSEAWSTRTPVHKSDIHRNIQSTLRMMDKCGFHSKMAHRARWRYNEKLLKLDAWNNFCKQQG